MTDRYQFHRFFTLWRVDEKHGFPFVGAVWWWPMNWVLGAVAIVVGLALHLYISARYGREDCEEDV